MDNTKVNIHEVNLHQIRMQSMDIAASSHLQTQHQIVTYGIGHMNNPYLSEFDVSDSRAI